MRLPDLRTNYGSGVGFFSLVEWGSGKDEALSKQRAKNDKSSSFRTVVSEMLRMSANGETWPILDTAGCLWNSVIQAIERS